MRWEHTFLRGANFLNVQFISGYTAVIYDQEYCLAASSDIPAVPQCCKTWTRTVIHNAFMNHLVQCTVHGSGGGTPSDTEIA